MLIYPLEWPIGWARSRTRSWSKFGRVGKRVTLPAATDNLLHELELLGATDVKISTNVRTNAGGERWRPDAPEPRDTGAAVYFRIGGDSRALAVDKWTRTADNLHALALHIGAMRGQLRWGVGSIAQAFGGYKALTAMGAPKLWYEVLGLPHTATKDEIDRRRLELLGKLHPDRPGGDAEAAADVNAAYREALELLKAEASE